VLASGLGEIQNSSKVIGAKREMVRKKMTHHDLAEPFLRDIND
jgi:hypothetical protein